MESLNEFSPSYEGTLSSEKKDIQNTDNKLVNVGNSSSQKKKSRNQSSSFKYGSDALLKEDSLDD